MPLGLINSMASLGGSVVFPMKHFFFVALTQSATGIYGTFLNFPNVAMHVCPVARCQRSFKRRFNLLRHVRRVHPTNQHHDIASNNQEDISSSTSSQSVDR